MDNNTIIKRLLDLTKDMVAIKNNIEELQNSVDENFKHLFNTAIYLVKECTNEISNIAFELK
ncbi:MAG: hypothetical protein ACFFDN_21900 [Candidatus Hodarchaeota archaeon]